MGNQSYNFWEIFWLVFTSDGLNDPLKTAFRFHSWLSRLWSSENQVVRVGSRSGRRKPITKCGNVQRDWFYFCFRLWQAGFHLIISNLVISGGERKWKHSDYSNCNSPYDSAYDSDFWFSQGHRRSYDSTYDFDYVSRENQPLRVILHMATSKFNDNLATN